MLSYDSWFWKAELLILRSPVTTTARSSQRVGSERSAHRLMFRVDRNSAAKIRVPAASHHAIDISLTAQRK